MKESIELLKTLTDVNGIAGYEYQVKEKNARLFNTY